jgi:antibiotic biosynthesis monooxygenase (ABM) superfamily enzyme
MAGTAEQLREPSQESVTVTVTRRALPGREAEMGAWVQAGQRLASQFPGFLGAGHVRPAGDGDVWHMLYRFADGGSLRRWESSGERQWWLASALGLVQEEQVERRTGIEGWFDEPRAREVSTAPRTPPRWKQACVIWVAFFPTNLLAQWLLTPLLDGVPLVLRVLALTVVLIPVMTYLVLPWVTRRLQWWLEGRPAPWRRRGRTGPGAGR